MTVIVPRFLPPPRVVLFDWDDTVVDNWEYAFAALNAALTHMGHPPWSPEEARRQAGPSARDMFTGLFGADRWEEAEKVYFDTFIKLALEKINMFNGMEDIFRFLQSAGVFQGVVSNKRGSLLRQEIAASGMEPYFGAIVGAGDASADKPNPEPIWLALERGGQKPGPEVWYIGDSHTDMIAALKAGCTPVLIETKLPPEDLLADYPPAGRAQDHVKLMELFKGHLT